MVALRADMDALGHIIDGRLEARHTCGHDGHSSVVLTAAEEILAEGLVKRGKLKVLFQPAELQKIFYLLLPHIRRDLIYV